MSIAVQDDLLRTGGRSTLCVRGHAAAMDGLKWSVPGIASLWIVLAAVGSILGVSGDANAQEEVDLAVYEEAVRQWRREVEFSCTFVFKKGRAESLEAGLRGDFRPGSKVTVAHGRMAKQGRRVRFALNYDEGAVKLGHEVGPNGQMTTVSTNTSFDEMTDHLVDVRYHPQDPKEPTFGNLVGFSKRSEESLPFPEFQAGSFTAGIASPLAPFGSYGRSLFTGVRETDVAPVEIMITVEDTDPEHVRISTSRQSPNGATLAYVTRVWTKPSPPVVERIKYTSSGRVGDRDIVSVSHALMSGFVDCDGYKVPRRIVCVSESYSGNAFLLEVWESSDLGDRPCTEEDFTIHVSPKTRFGGLSHPIRAIETKEVRLSELSLDDIGHRSFRDPAFAPQPAAKKRGLPSSETRFILLLINGIAIAGFLLFLVVRRRKGKPEGEGPK